MTRARQRGQQPISVEALASGTANSETFLSGGGTWQVVDVDATVIENGSSNVGVSLANANVSVSVNGVSNVFTVTSISVSTTGNIATSATGFLQVATGNTATRPDTPAIGMMRFNTDNNGLEIYTTKGWQRAFGVNPTLTQVSGDITNGSASTLTLTGTNFITSPGVVRFTAGETVANVTVTPASTTSASVTVPSAIFNLSAGTVVGVQFVNSDSSATNIVNKTIIAGTVAEYLVIAGGGAGSTRGDPFAGAGGGGGGGYVDGSLSISTGVSYTVTVGAGGSSPTSGNGTNGGNSVFSSITALGGGRSGDISNAGASGGSGGGSGRNGGGAGGSATQPGSASGGHGNAGGTGTSESGGGGGAGGAGLTGASSRRGGNGGAGRSSSITGSSVARAGGGGGSSYEDTNGSLVGVGAAGGGNGGWETPFGPYVTTPGTSGTSNTGGGGGAERGNGGSGVVILRYPSTLTISNPGGGLTFTTTTVSSDKVTTFTAGTGNIQFT